MRARPRTTFRDFRVSNFGFVSDFEIRISDLARSNPTKNCLLGKCKRLIPALALIVTGCTTNDYRSTGYYRTTQQRLEATLAHSKRPGESSKLFAGVARVDITPPVGTPLQGFGGRRGEPSKGVHDPLYARVLVLKNSQSRLVLVSCDLMGVTKNLYDAVFERVRRTMPLERREFILFATHTHSGAGGLSNRFAMQFVGGRFRPRLFAETADKIAGAILEAAQHTQPAEIACGSGTVDDLNRNRAWPDGAVDREVKVLRVTGVDNKPLGWLVNFAAHATVFGANWEFTADFPGYLALELEREGAVCLFANGAAGDLNIKGRRESHEIKAARAGKTLAEKALQIAGSMQPRDEGAIEMRRVEVLLPPVRLRMGHNPNCALPSCLGNCLFPREVPIELVRIDRTLFLAAPVEFCAEIGLDLKAAASRLGYDLFILGYANDYIGYVVPERHYSTREYEARTSFYGPKLDSYLKEVAVKMIEGMTR